MESEAAHEKLIPFPQKKQKLEIDFSVSFPSRRHTQARAGRAGAAMAAAIRQVIAKRIGGGLLQRTQRAVGRRLSGSTTVRRTTTPSCCHCLFVSILNLLGLNKRWDFYPLLRGCRADTPGSNGRGEEGCRDSLGPDREEGRRALQSRRRVRRKVHR